jgi:hypothetical protein
MKLVTCLVLLSLTLTCADARNAETHWLRGGLWFFKHRELDAPMMAPAHSRSLQTAAPPAAPAGGSAQHAILCKLGFGPSSLPARSPHMLTHLS